MRPILMNDRRRCFAFAGWVDEDLRTECAAGVLFCAAGVAMGALVGRSVLLTGEGSDSSGFISTLSAALAFLSSSEAMVV